MHLIWLSADKTRCPGLCGLRQKSNYPGQPVIVHGNTWPLLTDRKSVYVDMAKSNGGSKMPKLSQGKKDVSVNTYLGYVNHATNAPSPVADDFLGNAV